MFGRNKNNSDETSTTVEPVSTTPGGKKGRPTPKRKQAEAARLHPLVPADRKEAKRAAEQRALVTGDEKHLPARDKGSARRFVRDYVDARHSFSEWVLLVMMASIILIMILSLFGNTIPEQTQIYILYGSTILMYGSFIVTGVEAMLVWRKIKAAFTQEHPRDEIPRGTGSSCAMISIARFFGAPVMLPPGKQAARASR